MSDDDEFITEAMANTVEISTAQHELYERHSRILGELCQVLAAEGYPNASPATAMEALVMALRTGVAARPIQRQILELSRYVTDSYPADVLAVPELVDRRRIDKIGEEFGEVIDAYGGYVGENPRKGVHATKRDVLAEVLDVATTALGAYEHLTDYRGRALHDLGEHVYRRHQRAGLS